MSITSGLKTLTARRTKSPSFDTTTTTKSRRGSELFSSLLFSSARRYRFYFYINPRGKNDKKVVNLNLFSIDWAFLMNMKMKLLFMGIFHSILVILCGTHQIESNLFCSLLLVTNASFFCLADDIYFNPSMIEKVTHQKSRVDFC